MEGARITGIPQVALTVPDLARAVAFYEGTLGLRVLFNTGSMAMLACGATRLMVATPAHNPTGQPMFLYFGVEDIQGAKAALEARGVRFKDPPHKVGSLSGRDVWLAAFDDGLGTLHHLLSEEPPNR